MNLFSILAISEHCLHEEQLDFFKTVTGDSYNYTAVSANDNPPQYNTNDLNKPSVSPQSLIGKLKEHVNDIKSFSNVFKIFLCKVPPRSDKHRVNSRISHFNNLLVDELLNADNVIIVETIPLEAKLFHTDNLHFNDEGLRQISGIILSVLYKVIAPDLYRPKRNYMSPKPNCA